MLPYHHKLCFTVKQYSAYSSAMRIRAPKSHDFIRASYEPFGNSKYINMDKIINEL